MSPNADAPAELKTAKEHEEKFKWLEAARSYERMLRSKVRTASSIAETYERMGFCYGHASMQVEDAEEFRKLEQLAVDAYKNAAKLFEKEDKNHGRSAQCNAIAEYLRSWLSSDPSEKRRMFEEACSFAKESLKAYEDAGDELNYGKMCNDALLCLLERLYAASDSEEMKTIVQEGTECAKKAIAILSKLGDKSELLRAYFTASLHDWYAANISEQEEEASAFAQRSSSYSEKALELSKEVNNPYYAAMSNWAAGICTLLFTEKAESALEYAKEMLRQATIVRDNYLKGVASYVLAFATNWMMVREGDPDKKKEGHEKIIKYAEDAIHCLQFVFQDYFIAQTYWVYAESCSSLARDVEATLEGKRALLEKAANLGRKGLEHATRSGSADATGVTLHALSKALQFYASLETRTEEKTRHLKEALIYREEHNKIGERAFPFNDWVRGVGKSYEGQIKAELAKAEADKDKKRAFLESAVSDMENGVSRCRKAISSHPVPTLIAALATFEDWFGGMLNDFYALTEDKRVLSRAVEIHEYAAQEFKRVNLPSRAAESYWKRARNLDRLGEHQEAARSFENAFAEYEVAAQRTPHFADFYLDYATYMKAWSEIEKANLAHKNEKYSSAMRHYEEIANLLKPSELWGYVSSNFFAWSLLEQAEDLSRKENNAEAIEVFKKAAQLFKEAKDSFEEEIGKIQNLDEKEKAIELGKASMHRRDYCLARVDVEEARIYDLRGDYAESAEEYDSAATKFEKMLETMETENDRKEIKPIAYMCRAWQKMKMADARASPELYGEASDLFLKAKEHSTKDRTNLLAQGNGAFCEALEHGTKFEATREKGDFAKAKQYLESAASYYLKAGFENASVWTSATEILFDAYNFMINAEIEDDPERKMKACLLAERCLEKSAKLYETAGYVGKRDEVLRILGKVKEKREFALSLGELMTAPSEALSTSMIPAPASSVEEPVGLLKFEGAFVQANLIVRQTEVVVGGSLGLEIQLVNLGKKTAFLMKVQEVIPEGFDLIEKPEKCMVNDGFIDLKARKVAPLGTEEMRITLRPRKKGKFAFTPKIQFMDEAGEYKSFVLEQVMVTVKELGIRGWLRGQG